MSMKHLKRFRRNWNTRSRSRIFVSIMVVLLVAYIYALRYIKVSDLADMISTITIIIAAVAFWLEYHENKLINQSQFIMELNDQFISNDELINVEWELEKYYAHYKDGTLTEEYKDGFEKKYHLENIERQHLVNYLVHLECMAALIKSGVIPLSAIDDLMSYRYFIALNNPIVRKMEFSVYSDYYLGCIETYQTWVKYLLEERGMKPPMYRKNDDFFIKILRKRERSFRNARKK